MAEIGLERKSHASWLWIILGLIVLALLLLWMWPDDEFDETAIAPVGIAEVEAPAAAETPPLPPAEVIVVPPIVTDPDVFIGRTVSGLVEVPDVPTDRGFWIENEGQRIFAILIDHPQEQPLDINPGQTLRLVEATVRDASYLDEMPGAPLDDDTRRIAEAQEVFLVVDETAIEIVERP